MLRIIFILSIKVFSVFFGIIYSLTLFFQHLYTSSPFSDYISLDMKPAPEGKLPVRPDEFPSPTGSGHPVTGNKSEGDVVMIAGPVIGAIFLVVICLFCFLFVWK